MTGAVISAVDVVRGLGKLTGLEVINVPGATGYFDTNYAGKAQYALDALDRHDFVWVHVEAPDEAGHAGSIDEKIRAIENIDKHVVGTLVDGMRKRDDFRLLICARSQDARANPRPCRRPGSLPAVRFAQSPAFGRKPALRRTRPRRCPYAPAGRLPPHRRVCLFLRVESKRATRQRPET